MSINTYLNTSGMAMSAVGIVYDNARSAEKMTDWDCIGENNQAWIDGPYLSSGANIKQIDRKHPYCIRTSKESAIIARITLGNSPPKGANGGVYIPLPPRNENSSRVEGIISKLAIIEQFELFKDFLDTFNGPYNIKKLTAWKDKIDIKMYDQLNGIIKRRNELTHEYSSKPATMMEAVEYFYNLRNIAQKLQEIT